MANQDPMEGLFLNLPASVSKRTFNIAGISVNVYGLEELGPSARNVSCIWLLHPRLQTQECMAPLATAILNSWNSRREKTTNGLLAVTFDQRNHGSREIDSLSNEAWRSGNEQHAQDMFSIYHGTSVDTSHLITYISSYVFPTSDRVFSSNIVLGVSLGGHAAWQCLLHDPRVSTAIVVVGCPDYYALMSDRAQLSKLRTGTDDSPPKEAFLGSKYFPAGLVEAVERYDPAGMLLGSLRDRTNATYVTSPSQAEQRRIVPLMTQSLSGKRILNLAGGADKLVPYRCAEPSLNWLKVSTSSSGWFSRGKFHIEDHVFEGVGHQMTIEMAEETMKFVATTLQQSIASNTQMASKI